MLTCLLVAGSLFLVDGDYLLRHDQVVSYNLSMDGRSLRATTTENDPYVGAGSRDNHISFDLPRAWQKIPTYQILRECEAVAKTHADPQPEVLADERKDFNARSLYGDYEPTPAPPEPKVGMSDIFR